MLDLIIMLAGFTVIIVLPIAGIALAWQVNKDRKHRQAGFRPSKKVSKQRKKHGKKAL